MHTRPKPPAATLRGDLRPGSLRVQTPCKGRSARLGGRPPRRWRNSLSVLLLRGSRTPRWTLSDVIGRWCGARHRSRLADAARGQTLFGRGAGFAGLRGRPSPSPEGRAGRRQRGAHRVWQCRLRPAGAAEVQGARAESGVFGRARGAGPGPGGTWFASGRGPAAGAQRRWGWPPCSLLDPCGAEVPALA